MIASEVKSREMGGGRSGGGGVVPRPYGFCLFLLLTAGVVAAASSGGVTISSAVLVDGKAAIAETDEDFVCATLDWWPPEKCDYGTCSWGLASMLNLDLSNPILLNAVRAFSPLKLRLGGSLQDKVMYETGDPKQPCRPFIKNDTEMFGFSEGCLPMSRWDELNMFFKKAGAAVIFGLNALSGRVSQSDGSVAGPWNYTNAASLIRYTVNKGYTIHGWELGNELCGTGVGTRVDAGQYAADTVALGSIIDVTYRGFSVKPLVIAPGGFFDAAWFAELVRKTKPNSLDAVTHHVYNLGPGVDDHLVEKILDPTYLDGEASTFAQLQGILKNGGTAARAWVGEAGGAYNSGRHLVSDSFVYSFWYLDQMGMAATYGTRTYCRQTLVGGNYGLLNTTTFHPNPDYYSALLWHRLMGTKVLAANFTGTKMIRAYAHCARGSQGITVLLINLSTNTTSQVFPAAFNHSSIPGHIGRKRSGQLQREEYHLTAKNGDLHSQAVLLNDKILDVDSGGGIPQLVPVKVEPSEPIALAPLSIVFARIPYFDAPACS